MLSMGSGSGQYILLATDMILFNMEANLFHGLVLTNGVLVGYYAVSPAVDFPCRFVFSLELVPRDSQGADIQWLSIQLWPVFSKIPPFLAVGELLVERSRDICNHIKSMFAGLGIGTKLPLVDVLVASSHVRSGSAELLVFHADVKFEERKTMYDYASYLVPHHAKSLRCLFLIPLTSDDHPDFSALIRLVGNPRGLEDRDSITEAGYNRRIVMSTYGRTYLAMTCPPYLSRAPAHHRLLFRRTTNTLSANGRGRTPTSVT